MIDCHSHYYPEWYLDLLRERDHAPRVVRAGDREYFQAVDAEDRFGAAGASPPGQPMDRGFWDPAEKLKFMDEQGIDVSVVSAGNPWLDFVPGERSRQLAEDLNAELAGLPARSDSRLVPMGVLPNSDVDDCLATVEQLDNDERFVGVITGVTICGRPLEDPGLRAIWRALGRARLTVFVHPSAGCAELGLLRGFAHLLPLGMGFLFESSAAAIRLAVGGVLDEPGVRILLPHAGGVLPSVLGRLEALTNALHPEAVPGLDRLRQAHVDSIAAGDIAWQAAVGTFGLDHIVFGSDHPFLLGGRTAVEAGLSRLAEAGWAGQATAHTAFPRLT